MSFWKKLKKIKGIDVLKSTLKIIPGGAQINAGVKILEKTISSIKGEQKKPTSTTPTFSKEKLKNVASSPTDELVSGGKSTMLYLVAGVILFIVLSKGKI